MKYGLGAEVTCELLLDGRLEFYSRELGHAFSDDFNSIKAFLGPNYRFPFSFFFLFLLGSIGTTKQM